MHVSEWFDYSQDEDRTADVLKCALLFPPSSVSLLWIVIGVISLKVLSNHTKAEDNGDVGGRLRREWTRVIGSASGGDKDQTGMVTDFLTDAFFFAEVSVFRFVLLMEGC